MKTTGPKSPRAQQSEFDLSHMVDGGSGKKAYYAAMDGLRTVAITMVLVEHFGGPLGSYWAAGYYGVDLFFVISGFLITAILIRNPASSFRESYVKFMGRRSLRIFPVYYFALLLLWIGNFPQTRENMLYLATYTWNYATVHFKGEGNNLFYLWSLAVEEQFYLVWPLIALTLRRNLVALFVVTICIVAIGYSQLVLNVFPSLQPYNYVGLINRMGSLGLGAAGAIAVSLRWFPRFWYQSLTFEIVVFAVLGCALTTDQVFRLPLLGFCSLVLVTKSMEGRFRVPGVAAVLQSRIAVYIGQISYGIYVYHWPLGVWLTWYVFDPIWTNIDFSLLGPLSILRWHAWIVKLPLFFAVTVFVAHLSHKYFERPILRLKDRWFPTRSAMDDRTRSLTLSPVRSDDSPEMLH
ncbi:acyltransferase family protein [Rosistilla ulvae]|nr:acyltransferase [Rosistilla ulvae]